MDKEKINNLIDRFANMDSKEFDTLAAKAERAHAKEKDKEALESGIERLTLFFANGGTGLLVKPNPLLGAMLINLFEGGSINCPSDADISFELNVIPSELYRLGVKMNGVTYWNDLIDEQMARDTATFLDVPITNALER